MEDAQMKEGFLCPVCIKDLGSIVELQTHFDSAHSHEDSDIKQALFEFINRARSRLVKDADDVTTSSSSSSCLVTVPFLPYMYRLPHWQTDVQDCGAITSHSAVFRATRDERTSHWAAHAMRIAVRVRTLTAHMPADPLKRRAFEQRVVSWADDTHVDQCPDCGRRFDVLRRKHHCRACGFVMCGRCSLHVRLSEAARLVSDCDDATTTTAGVGDATESKNSAVARAARAIDSLLLTINRQSVSLDSTLDSSLAAAATAADTDTDTAEPLLRLCRHCGELLARRHWKRHELVGQHTTVSLQRDYEAMRERREQLHDLLHQHNTQLRSLMAGEGHSSLTELRQLRATVLRAVAAVDELVKRVAADGVDEPPRTRQLRQRVCAAMSAHIQSEVMANLEQLPSTQQQLADMRGASRA